MQNALSFAQSLIRIDTCDPPGRESRAGRALLPMLEKAGLRIETLPIAPDRENFIASLPGSDGALAPLVLTGHLDTVPVGDQPWSRDAFSGEVAEGRLYGRGSSDMKAGIGAMIQSVIMRAKLGKTPRRGVALVLTVGEEVGCAGVRALIESAKMPRAASAVLVGEPTGNRLARGHKGILCLRAHFHGVSAHSSMPERGQNAIYRAARAINSLETLSLDHLQSDDLLGKHTLNVGVFKGGRNYNSVPDAAEFTVDLRTNGRVSHDSIAALIQSEVGADATIDREIDLSAVSTDAGDPFLQLVADLGRQYWGARFTEERQSVPYFTDAALLQPFWKCPVAILGPGDAEQAHRTNESCDVEAIGQAASFYEALIGAWCS